MTRQELNSKGFSCRLTDNGKLRQCTWYIYADSKIEESEMIPEDNEQKQSEIVFNINKCKFVRPRFRRVVIQHWKRSQ